MKRYVDLHLHTCYSDGTSQPEELLELVRNSRIQAFAVTDHDTLQGFRAVRKLLREDDPELIPGVELSVTVDEADMHLLAYLFEPDDVTFRQALDDFQNHRNQRGKVMVERLNSLGIDISFDDVVRQSHGTVVGRPHVARAIFENGATNSYEEAFAKYIGNDGPAYVPKVNFTPQKAMELIHQAGGLAVLAHPGVGEKDRHLDMLIELGLDGIEAYHPSHQQSQVDRYRHMAEQHRLIVTGGSDFHGLNGRYDAVGSQKVPYECVEKLKSIQKVRRV